MTTKIQHYQGITGRHIDDVKLSLEGVLWEYCGIDRVDYKTVHGFERGNTSIGVYVDDAGICGKVEEREEA